MTSLVHLFIVEYLSISPWLLSNVWGCACIFVFMDSVVLANDLKVMEIKNNELEMRFLLMETLYSKENLELRDKDKSYIKTQNRLLSNLSNQSTHIKSEIFSVSSSISNFSNDISFLKSHSLNNLPEVYPANSASASAVPSLKKTVSLDSNSNMLSRIQDSSEIRYSRFNRARPNISLDSELFITN